MSLVLFLALPLSVLVWVDDIKVKQEIQYEMRQLKKFEKKLQEKGTGQ
jgi:hypothetical protein